MTMSENGQPCYQSGVMMPSMNGRNGELTDQDFKKIIARRDARYDGRFFFGVKTTKIYCRVSCPARPKLENIVLYRSASEAERAGLRPCLRCRPDAAPGSRILDGTSNTVARALRLIEKSTDENLGVEKLSQHLGVSDRHLRRLFDVHLGASPMEIMMTQRLHLAKRLITETNGPMSQIAFAVGFQSIRRFNDAFKNLFERAPSEFRKTGRKVPSAIELAILIRPPYDWESVIAYLKRHEAFGIEKVGEKCYQRFLEIDGRVASLTVQPGKRASELKVSLQGVPLTEIRGVLAKLKSVFDTEHNPMHLPPSKAPRSNGVRVPGGFDTFEMAVSIVLSQLVSTKQAKNNLKSLIMKFGRPLDASREIYVFPQPATLKNAPLESIGITKAKAGALRELARLIDEGLLELSTTVDLKKTREALLAIRGVGPWTTEMIAMRCLGDPDAFPKGDLIVHRVLLENSAIEDKWATSRAYLTHCLWRDSNLQQKDLK